MERKPLERWRKHFIRFLNTDDRNNTGNREVNKGELELDSTLEIVGDRG